MPLSRLSLIAAATLTTALLASTSSQADVDKAIEYRQDALGVMAWQIGPLGDMAQGKIDYDAEVFARRAENLAAVAPLPWEGFMEGTLRDDGHGVETEALAKIGDDWEGFHERRDTFIEEANTLAKMVENGEEFADLRQQVGAVANSCKGCHDNYRAE